MWNPLQNFTVVRIQQWCHSVLVNSYCSCSNYVANLDLVLMNTLIFPLPKTIPPLGATNALRVLAFATGIKWRNHVSQCFTHSTAVEVSAHVVFRRTWAWPPENGCSCLTCQHLRASRQQFLKSTANCAPQDCSQTYECVHVYEIQSGFLGLLV